MTEKQISIDLDDPRISQIADILNNKTAKRILGELAENELSVVEIARKLKAPINTIDYNIKKLKEAGFLESSKSFWSVKGKRMPVYRVSQKKIVISPKTSFKGILPSLLISGIASIGITYFLKKEPSYIPEQSLDSLSKSSEFIAYSGESISSEVVSTVSSFDPALWFFFGASISILLFLLWNWRRL